MRHDLRFCPHVKRFVHVFAFCALLLLSPLVSPFADFDAMPTLARIRAASTPGTASFAARYHGGMHAPQFPDFDSYRAAFSRVLTQVAERVPQLRDRAMLHGTAAGSLGGLRHRESWDLDLMGRQFGCSVSDLADQMERRLRGHIRWHSREEETSMFMGRLALPDLPEIDVQLFSNVHESIDFSPSPEPDFGGMPAICVDDYAEMKAQSLLERNQPKDLRDFAACFSRDITSYAARRSINKFSAGSLQRVLARAQRTNGERLPAAAPGFRPTTVEDLASLAEHCDNRIKKLKLVALHRRECPAF